MTFPPSPEQRKMAEPQPAPEGADLGGMASTADAGLERATTRSMENADADPVGPASTGDASGGGEAPRVDLGGKAAPGSAGGASDAPNRPASDARASPPRADAGARPAPNTPSDAWREDDDEDNARHSPVAPVDESPLESLGKSVGEALTGSVDDPRPRKPRG
jgi:hypothetical protein